MSGSGVGAARAYSARLEVLAPFVGTRPRGNSTGNFCNLKTVLVALAGLGGIRPKLAPIREGSLFIRCSELQIQAKVQTRKQGVVSLQPKTPTLSRTRDRNVLRFSVV